MTKADLKKQLAECREELKQCQVKLADALFGKSKGGTASSRKQAENGKILRAFWSTSARSIMQDLLDNDPRKWINTTVDELVDAVAASVEAHGFPFKATRSKDAIKRHLTSTFMKGIKPYIPPK